MDVAVVIGDKGSYWKGCYVIGGDGCGTRLRHLRLMLRGWKVGHLKKCEITVRIEGKFHLLERHRCLVFETLNPGKFPVSKIRVKKNLKKNEVWKLNIFCWMKFENQWSAMVFLKWPLNVKSKEDNSIFSVFVLINYIFLVSLIVRNHVQYSNAVVLFVIIRNSWVMVPWCVKCWAPYTA